ncbi:hypothetical protein PV797_16985 [Clostridiaceae bacterium M8S5]|nr:hypothetical protein PV797_16985 [Clostridiaceae bacterium M8S5]
MLDTIVCVITLILLLIVECLLWNYFKKNKKKNIYLVVGGMLVISIVFICILVYLLVAIIPYPNARGTSKDAWISFWGSIIGCSIGGIIGGIVAFKIMQYQLKKEREQNREQAIEDRKEKMKLDLQMDTINEFTNIIGNFSKSTLMIPQMVNELLFLLDHEIYSKEEANRMINEFRKETSFLQINCNKLVGILSSKAVIINMIIDKKKVKDVCNGVSSQVANCIILGGYLKNIILFINLKKGCYSSNDFYYINKFKKNIVNHYNNIYINSAVENLNILLKIGNLCQKFIGDIFNLDFNIDDRKFDDMFEPVEFNSFDKGMESSADSN